MNDQESGKEESSRQRSVCTKVVRKMEGSYLTISVRDVALKCLQKVVGGHRGLFIAVPYTFW